MVTNRVRRIGDLFECVQIMIILVPVNSEISCLLGSIASADGRLWRLAVLGDPTVDKFLVRDTDR